MVGDAMAKVRTAVVLAGGEALRLKPYTSDRPKAMLLVAGKPLLEWVVDWLKSSGIQNIVIGVAFQKEKVIEHFGDGSSFGVNIRYSVHTVEGGTAEGFRLAISRHVNDDVFLAMNGDELTDLDLEEFASFHLRSRPVVTIAVTPLRSPFGVVDVVGDDVISFREKPVIETHLVSIGVYMFDRHILGYLPTTGDIERTSFPLLVTERRLKAYRHNGFWMTINNVKDLVEVEKELSRRKK
jgi:NDP-sugar pyrophosphorylase family protein